MDSYGPDKKERATLRANTIILSSLVSGLMQTLHLKTGAQAHSLGKARHTCQQISLLPTIVSFPLLLTCLPTTRI